MSEQENIIHIKIQRSKSAFAEAELMIQNQFYNAAVNRLYYSCFYATQALLLTKNIVSKTHNGTVAHLFEQFTRQGNFDKQLSGFYAKLMQRRKDSDYGDFLIVTKEEAEDSEEKVKEYLDYIITLILQSGTPGKADSPAP